MCNLCLYKHMVHVVGKVIFWHVYLWCALVMCGGSTGNVLIVVSADTAKDKYCLSNPPNSDFGFRKRNKTILCFSSSSLYLWLTWSSPMKLLVWFVLRLLELTTGQQTVGVHYSGGEDLDLSLQLQGVGLHTGKMSLPGTQVQLW